MSDPLKNELTLARDLDRIGVHEHLLQIFETQEEQLAALASFVQNGLERGEQCLFLSNETTSKNLIQAIRASGLNLGIPARSEVIKIARKKDFFSQGQIDPDMALLFLEESCHDARKKGFSGLRVISNLNPGLGSDSTLRQFFEFEAKLNRFLQDHNISILCQYNRSETSPEVLLNLIHTHPFIFQGGLVCKNFYFIPPEDFIKPTPPDNAVNRMLDNIYTHAREVEVLQKNEERYRETFEDAAVGIAISIIDGKWVKVNNAMCEFTGYSEKEMVKMFFGEITHPDDLEADLTLTDRIRKGEISSGQLEKRFIHKNGKVIWGLLSVTAVRNDQREIKYWISQVEDITKRKQAEIALRESEERFRKIFDEGPLSISLLDLDGKVRAVNQAACDFLGYTKDEIIKLGVAGTTHPEDNTLDYQLLLRLLKGEIPFYAIEKRYIRKDGKIIWGHLTRSLIRDDHKNPIYILGMLQDINQRREIEEKLRESEERFRKIFDEGPVGITLLDLEGNIKEVNQLVLDNLGLSRKEFLELGIAGISLPEDSIFESNQLKRLVNGEISSYSYEKRNIRKDGQIIWGQITRSVMHDSNNRPINIIGMFLDITERKKVEKALQESEGQFRSAFEFSAIGMTLTGIDCHWLKVNRAMSEMVGYSEQELINMSFMEITHPDDLAEDLRHTSQLITGEISTFEIEKRFIHKNGQIVWVILSASMVKDNMGQPLYMISQVQNITERKQAAEALQESEEQFRSALEFSAIGMTLTGIDGHLLKVNRAMCEMVGYSEQELIKMNFFEITYPDDLVENEHYTNQLTAGEISTFEMEKRFIHKNGQIVWAILSASLVRNNYGKPLYIVGQAQNITERKRVEEELRESERRFRAIFEGAVNGIRIGDFRGYTIDCNPAYQKMLGFSFEEIKSRKFTEYTFPEDVDRDNQLFHEMLDGKRDHYELEKRYIRKDGEIIWGHLNTSLVRGADGKPLMEIVIVEDITERKQMMEALYESEEFFRNVFELAPIGITFLTPTGQWIRVNQVFSNLVGYSKEELVNMNFMQITHPDDIEPDMKLGDRVLADEIQNYQFEKRYFHKNGNIIWTIVAISAVRDNKGNPLYLISQVQDITKRKRIEEELRISEARFRTIFEEALSGISTATLEGHLIEANPSYLKMIGYTMDELSTMTFADFTYPEDLSMDLGLYNEQRYGKRDHYELEKRYIRKNGEIFWAHLSVSIVKDETGKPLFEIGIVDDISQRKQYEKELVLLNSELQAIFNAYPDLLFRFNKQGVYLDYKGRPQLLYSPPEVFLNKPISEILPPEVATEFFDCIHRSITSQEVIGFEYPLPYPGHNEWNEARFVPLNENEVFAIVRDITSRKQAEQEREELLKQLLAARSHLQNLSRQVVNAQEEERRRISGELHDEVGQSLTVIKIGLKSIQSEIPGLSGEQGQTIGGTLSLIDQTMEHMRSLAQSLRPPTLDSLGLSRTLENMCRLHGRMTKLSIRFSSSPVPVLADEVNICLYRFLQEALTNVSKHAAARQVFVTLSNDPQRISLSIKDDGHGFDPGSILSAENGVPNGLEESQFGIGLLGMKERIELLGGKMEIVTNIGEGTCITATIPL